MGLVLTAMAVQLVIFGLMKLGVMPVVAGNAGLGAAIGAGAGLAGGYVYDQHEKSKESAYKEGYKAGQQSPTKSQ